MEDLVLYTTIRRFDPVVPQADASAYSAVIPHDKIVFDRDLGNVGEYNAPVSGKSTASMVESSNGYTSYRYQLGGETAPMDLAKYLTYAVVKGMCFS